MRTYRTNAGPVRERPYYKLHEIEDICAEALRQVELYPSAPEPIRIERFIENHGPVVRIADDPHAFVHAIRTSRLESDPAAVARRLDVARSYDWKGRLEMMSNEMAQVLSRRHAVPSGRARSVS